jgi:type I restriction enzyme S subunit
MGGEWEEFLISDLCSLIVDCVNKTAPKIDHKTPYKMLRNVHEITSLS